MLSVALAWIVGVYIGGMPVNTVMAGFPSQLFLTLAGVTLLFALAQSQRHARRSSRITRCASAAATRGTIPIMFFVLGAALSSIGPGNIATAALLDADRDGHAARAGIPLFLMAIMVGNGANAGALSPFAPTGIIVNGIMAQERACRASKRRPTSTTSLAHAAGRVRRLRALRRPEAVRAPSRTRPTVDGSGRARRAFDRRQWITLARHRRADRQRARLQASTSGWPRSSAPSPRADRRGRRRRGDQADAVAGDRHGVRRDGAHRAASSKSQGIDLIVSLVARISTPDTVTGVVALLTGIVSVYSSTSGVVLPAFLPLVPGLAAQLPGASAVGDRDLDEHRRPSGGRLAALDDRRAVHRRRRRDDSRKLFNQLLAWGLSMAVVGAVSATCCSEGRQKWWTTLINC